MRSIFKDSNWNEDVGHTFAGAERWGRSFLYRVSSAVLRQPRAPSVELSRLRKILIIKEPYRMGDLMQITPSLRAIKERLPAAHVGLVIQDRNEPVFRASPHVDELILYEKRSINRNPLRALAFLRRIRARGFDLAVTLETDRVHLTNDLIAYYSGAPLRARCDSSRWDGGLSNVFYNVLSPPDPAAVHQVDRNFGILKSLGFELLSRQLALAIPEADRAAAGRSLRAHGLRDGEFVFIHPGAYKLGNRWPLENYLEVGRRLRSKGRKVLFSLGPAEMDAAEMIRDEGFALEAAPPLLQLAAVIGSAALALCNDTGILHLSGALGTRTVALFAATDPLQWKPPGDHVLAIVSADHDIASIPIERVYSVVSEQI